MTNPPDTSTESQAKEESWIEEVFADCKARVVALPLSVVEAELRSGRRNGRGSIIEWP
jgi:hypothetical protein